MNSLLSRLRALLRPTKALSKRSVGVSHRPGWPAIQPVFTAIPVAVRRTSLSRSMGRDSQ